MLTLGKTVLFTGTLFLIRKLFVPLLFTDYYDFFIVLIYLFLHLEFIIKHSKSALQALSFDWMMMNPKSKQVRIYITMISEILFFYVVYFDKVIGTLCYFLVFRLDLAFPLLFSFFFASFSYTLVRVYALKKRELIKKQTGLKSISLFSYIMKTAVALTLIQMFLGFLIRSFQLLKKIIFNQGMNTNSLRKVDTALSEQWHQELDKLFFIFKKIQQF